MAYKQGGLSNDEKRQIENLIPFNTYKKVAQTLNRKPDTIRKFCQRNGLTKDSTSVKKFAKARVMENKHFRELENQLTDSELELAYSIYEELMKQFGGDVMYSEEVQVIDFGVVTCLVNRTLSTEKTLMEEIDRQQKKRGDLELKRLKAIESNDEDEQEKLYEKIEMIDLRIADLTEESRANKKQQGDLLTKKSAAIKSIHGSREQRAKDLMKSNDNFADLIRYTQKDPKFRIQLGEDLEKNRIGMQAEYIRLSELHTYIDGEVDLPITKVDTVDMIEETDE